MTKFVVVVLLATFADVHQLVDESDFNLFEFFLEMFLYVVVNLSNWFSHFGVEFVLNWVVSSNLDVEYLPTSSFEIKAHLFPSL